MTSRTPSLSLDEGIHVIDVKAMDKADNAIVKTVHVMVDTVVPTLTIDGPAEGSYSASSSVTVSWTGNDGMSGVAGYIYRLDGKDWTEMSDDTSHTFDGLGEGHAPGRGAGLRHVRQLCQGQRELHRGHAWRRLISITSPSGTVYSNSSSVPVIWNGSDPTSGINGYRYRLDSDGWSVLTQRPVHMCSPDCPRAATPVNVRAYDQADNYAAVSVTFIVDTVRPAISFSAPDGRSEHRQHLDDRHLGRSRPDLRHPRLPLQPGRQRLVRNDLRHHVHVHQPDGRAAHRRGLRL